MKINIGTKCIGKECPAYIIAEGCDNHLGDIDKAKAMVDQAKIAGADAIKFQHHLPDEEMLKVLNTAEVCVNPDEYNKMNDKSTMNKIMEYMSLAKPIVQFDLTEGRYSAGEASLYARRNDVVDLAEKIVELLDDPERRAEMGHYGRRRVENELAWTYEEPKLLRAYNTLWDSDHSCQNTESSPT